MSLNSRLQVNIRTRDNVVHGTKSIAEFLEDLAEDVKHFR